jgi:arsenate reductase (glutaredoxin)
MLRIYHNPKCQKSRHGLEYIKRMSAEVEVIDYLKTGLTREILKEILLKTNLDPIDLVRKQEDFFIHDLKGKTFSREEWIEIIMENPRLLQRPIVVGRYKAVIAVPAEKAAEVMG